MTVYPGLESPGPESSCVTLSSCWLRAAAVKVPSVNRPSTSFPGLWRDEDEDEPCDEQLFRFLLSRGTDGVHLVAISWLLGLSFIGGMGGSALSLTTTCKFQCSWLPIRGAYMAT